MNENNPVDKIAPNDDEPFVVGFVLAGGLSTRMGQDKNFIEVDGLYALDRQCGLIDQFCRGGVHIVGSSDFLGSEFRWPVIIDQDDHQGPLGAIISALEYAGTGFCLPRWTMILANDLWSVTHDDIVLLIDRARKVPFEIDVLYTAATDIDGERIDQPLCSLWRTASSHEVLKKSYDSGQRSVMKAWETLHREIVFIDASHVINYNSPGDISQYRQQER